MGLLSAHCRKRNYPDYIAFILDGPLVASLEGVLLGTKHRLPCPIQGEVRHHEKPQRHISPTKMLTEPFEQERKAICRKKLEKKVAGQIQAPHLPPNPAG
jgi:hypothetical protein